MPFKVKNVQLKDKWISFPKKTDIMITESR